MPFNTNFGIYLRTVKLKPKQYNNEIVEKIKGIFFGKFPTQFKDIDVANNALIKAIQKQDVKTVFDINYVILIQDIGIIMLPNIADIINAETSKERHNEILHLNRIFLNSLVSEYIQDGYNTPHEKSELLYFYLNIIKVYKEVYMIEVVKDQSEFIQYLERNYNEQETLAEEFDELMRIIDNGEDNINGLVDFCNYTHEQLEKISEQLYKIGITDYAASFRQVFSKHQQETCNWKYKMTSLMYLISLLFKDKPSYELDDICQHITGRITINGKPKTYKILRQTLRNLDEKNKFKGVKMSKEYSQIKRIFESISA